MQEQIQGLRHGADLARRLHRGHACLAMVLAVATVALCGAQSASAQTLRERLAARRAAAAQTEAADEIGRAHV